ncbi:MAG: hypothetical protein ACREQ9_23140 [Candidatus Binatia bacterium]
MQGVIRKRLTALAATVLAFGLQVGYAAPSRATTELRAVSCCADHCGHSERPAGAAECCNLGQANDGPAANAAVARADMPAAPTASLVGLFAASARPAGDFHVAAPRERAAPIFLLTRSLRL